MPRLPTILKANPFHCLSCHAQIFQWEKDWSTLWNNGGELMQNKWVLSIVRDGFRIPFNSTLLLSTVPISLSQSSSPLLREKITELLQKRAVERVQDPGTSGFYSRLFLDPKKNGKLCLSLLNQYIKKQQFKMETVKSVRQSILVNDWAVSIDLTDAYLHVPIHPRSRKYPRFISENQVFQFMALPFGMSLSVNFHQTDGRNSGSFASTCRLTISVPRRLAYKRSNTQQTHITHYISPSNGSKSRVHSKFKEVRFDTSSATFIGMEFLTQHNIVRVPTDCMESLLSFLRLQFQHNFSFLFWANSVQQQTWFS